MLRSDLTRKLMTYGLRETQVALELLEQQESPALNGQEVLQVWGLLSDCLDHHRDLALDDLRDLESQLAMRATVRILPTND